MPVNRERLHELVEKIPDDEVQAAEAALRRCQHGSRGHMDHVGMWVTNLYRARDFYERWFGARAGMLYSSARRPLQTYFLALDSGARLELPGSGRTQRKPISS